MTKQLIYSSCPDTIFIYEIVFFNKEHIVGVVNKFDNLKNIKHLKYNLNTSIWLLCLLNINTIILRLKLKSHNLF